MSVIWSGITEQGAIVPVQVDETGRVIATASTSDEFVKRSGDTMTGPLVLPGDPTKSLEAATKGYVDARPGGGNQVFAAGSFNFEFELLMSENIADFRYRGVGNYELYFQEPPPSKTYIVYAQATAYARILFCSQNNQLSFVLTGQNMANQDPLDTSGNFWVYVLPAPDFRSISKSV